MLSTVKWYAAKRGRTFYAARMTARPDRKVILMHIEIMGEKSVDHEDGDGLNNVRSNLRLATQSQNMGNQCRRADNTSGYKGVSWDKSREKWEAYITITGRRRRLGRFDDPKEAAEAYDRAAVLHFGRFARTNKDLL